MRQGELTRLTRLLTLLRRADLDSPRRRPTFMEVGGIARREVTISRVLAFFLDSEAEHGPGDLWLRSLLLAAASADGRFDPSGWQLAPTSTLAEVVTGNVDANLRIDVVAQTPNVDVGIENKIDASLHSDLAAYAGQVRDMADGRAPLLLTLILHVEAQATEAYSERCGDLGVALCNVTYESLFARVKEGVGDSLLAADRERFVHMRGFMRTIENLGVPAMEMDRALFESMGDNAPEVELMRDKIEEATRTTKAQGDRLVGVLADDAELADLGIGSPRT